MRLEMEDWMLRTAKRTQTLPDGWRWYSISSSKEHAPEGFMRMEGAVPSRFITRGPSKGEPVWSKPFEGTKRTLFIPLAEIDETKRLYEVETGRCSDCSGHGQEWAGWSASDGHRYQPCRSCNGSGLLAAMQSEVSHV